MQKNLIVIFLVVFILSFIIFAENHGSNTNVDTVTSATVNSTSGAASNIFNVNNIFGTKKTKYNFDIKFDPNKIKKDSAFVLPAKIFIENPGKWTGKSCEALKSYLNKNGISTFDKKRTQATLKILGFNAGRSFVPEYIYKEIASKTKVAFIIQPVISMKTSTGGGMLFPKNNFITHVELRIYSTSLNKWVYWAECSRRRRIVTFSILNAAQNYAGTAIDLTNSMKNTDKLWMRSFNDTIEKVLSPFIDYLNKSSDR